MFIKRNALLYTLWGIIFTLLYFFAWRLTYVDFSLVYFMPMLALAAVFIVLGLSSIFNSKARLVNTKKKAPAYVRNEKAFRVLTSNFIVLPVISIYAYMGVNCREAFCSYHIFEYVIPSISLYFVLTLVVAIFLSHCGTGSAAKSSKAKPTALEKLLLTNFEWKVFLLFTAVTIFFAYLTFIR